VSHPSDPLCACVCPSTLGSVLCPLLAAWSQSSLLGVWHTLFLVVCVLFATYLLSFSPLGGTWPAVFVERHAAVASRPLSHICVQLPEVAALPPEAPVEIEAMSHSAGA
jgi:hypothetical protein